MYCARPFSRPYGFTNKYLYLYLYESNVQRSASDTVSWKTTPYVSRFLVLKGNSILSGYFWALAQLKLSIFFYMAGS